MNYEVFKKVLECLESGKEPTYALRQAAEREKINVNELKRIVGEYNSEQTETVYGRDTSKSFFDYEE
jgi:predicted kinase